MKYLSLRYFILLIFSFSSRAQDVPKSVAEQSVLECTYKLTYQLDSTTAALRTEVMNLLIGKNISKFESRWVHKRDSAFADFSNVPKNQESIQAFVSRFASLPKSDFKYTIYKLSASGKTYYYDRVGSITYLCEEPAHFLKWTIASSTATVAGYTCQRATTVFAGRFFEAWFTREIAVSDGPYKFSGLPGLIVKISDTRQHYAFELIKLVKPQKSTLIKLPSESTTPATMAQLRQGGINYALALSSRQAAKGATVSEARIQEVREQVKRNNNPLELK